MIESEDHLLRAIAGEEGRTVWRELHCVRDHDLWQANALNRQVWCQFVILPLWDIPIFVHGAKPEAAIRGESSIIRAEALWLIDIGNFLVAFGGRIIAPHFAIAGHDQAAI